MKTRKTQYLGGDYLPASTHSIEDLRSTIVYRDCLSYMLCIHTYMYHIYEHMTGNLCIHVPVCVCMCHSITTTHRIQRLPVVYIMYTYIHVPYIIYVWQAIYVYMCQFVYTCAIILKTYNPPLYTEIAGRICYVYIHTCFIYMSIWHAIHVYMCQFAYTCAIVLQSTIVYRGCLSYMLWGGYG